MQDNPRKITASAGISGLTQTEAAEQLKQFGYNDLPAAKPKSAWRIVLNILREPMLILLVSCGTLYMLLGDPGEGIMLMASVMIVIFISYYQEKKTERALEALRDLSSPRALVIRDGIEKRIAGKEVVPGDVVVLQEGDRIPADAAILSCINLQIDESMLTGESVAVNKPAPVVAVANTNNKPTLIFSGTLVVRGHGIAEVTATGPNTELGKIGKLLGNIEEEPSLLQRETRRIVRIFSIMGLIVCALLTLVYGFSRHEWMDGILYGLSLAMAMLPEEFAVVLTLFMALGAWRLSKKKVLTRNSASIETLGSVTVLCTDKTGTLTENRMKVRKLQHNGIIFEPGDKQQSISPEFRNLLETAVLAGQDKPFDPMEKAIVFTSEIYGQEKSSKVQEQILVKEYPLSPQLFSMTRVYSNPNEKTNVVAAKGAPEAIALLCRMSESALEELNRQVTDMASDGLRVLGVAQATQMGSTFPEDQHGFDFTFAGLIGMEDPLRETIADDLHSCYSAGIRVIMVTGDYPATASNIAQKMGLRNPEEVITGTELAAMTDGQLLERIKTVNIFARMIPEQKLRLVESLKANNEVVGMTGDGVNDAPALRAAHIGIAMGQRGTDVAREASDLVLLDDNFSSIISGVRTGRRINDNIRKAMTYIFAVHVPIAGLTLVPVLLPALPVIMFPLHIAFMELIIDPASTLIFEAEDEEKNIMTRKPADMHSPAFGTKRIMYGLLMGLSVLLICLAVYFISRHLNRPVDEMRTLTFTTLIIANIGLIFINRSTTRSIIELFRERNRAVRWVVGGAMAFLSLVLFVPPVRSLFHFDILHPDDLLICLGAGILAIAWFELIKIIRRKREMF